MEWDREKETLTLCCVDLAVMSRCNMDIRELLRKTKGKAVPFRSVLTYLLYSAHAGTEPRFWKYYRGTLLLAEERDRHYTKVFIPKNGGGKRVLHIPDSLLSYQQRIILSDVLEYLPVSGCAYAYRKGISMADCAKPHIRQEMLIHLDIENFFGSIGEELVFRCLRRDTGYSAGLVRFLGKLCCYMGFLPQGACTSPTLSNICFRDCDDAIACYAGDHGLRYTRYSDDLYLSGSICDAKVVIEAVGDILHEYGFRLNHNKSQILRRSRSQHILGLTVNEKIQVSRSYRRTLRQELYYLKRYGTEAAGAKDAPDYLNYLYKLQGKISYVLSVDHENVELGKAKEEIISQIAACLRYRTE